VTVIDSGNFEAGHVDVQVASGPEYTVAAEESIITTESEPVYKTVPTLIVYFTVLGTDCKTT